AHLLFGVERCRQLRDARLGLGTGALAACQKALQARTLGLGTGERSAQRRKRILEILIGRALQGQKLRQLVDLRVEPVEHLVLAADLAAEQELRQHENREQEHDGEQQRRQRIDEAWPEIDAALPPVASRQRHYLRSLSASAICSRIAREALCSSDCASTQSRIICCSWRMLRTSSLMPSARLASAAVTRGLGPLSCRARRRSLRRRTSSDGSFEWAGACSVPM